MALNLLNLDPDVRKAMIDEIDHDITSGKLYLSPRLSASGANDYPGLLHQAAESHDDAWLAAQMSSSGRLNATEERKTKRGIVSAKVPYDAHEVLSEGEFNRFYIRGVCVVAQQRGITSVVAYRAKHVSNPRPESEAMIGKAIDSARLLDDLRSHPGVDTALGLPAGPNSGLSAKLP